MVYHQDLVVFVFDQKFLLVIHHAHFLQIVPYYILIHGVLFLLGYLLLFLHILLHHHNLLPTMQVKIRELDQWVTVLEHGALASFEDVGVRALA